MWWVGKMGYDKEDMYGANIFTAQSAESLRASGFYATAADTSYKLYVVKNFENEYSFKNKTLVAEGSLKMQAITLLILMSLLIWSPVSVMPLYFI